MHTPASCSRTLLLERRMSCPFLETSKFDWPASNQNMWETISFFRLIVESNTSGNRFLKQDQTEIKTNNPNKTKSPLGLFFQGALLTESPGRGDQIIVAVLAKKVSWFCLQNINAEKLTEFGSCSAFLLFNIMPITPSLFCWCLQC